MEQYPLPEKDYMVLIRCYTYNHEKYIEDALKGFVMQKTNFPFVAIIVDDASTDRTADIIRKYEKEYPDIIKGIYLKENHYSQKKKKITYVLPWRNRCKYEAFCEGDDYWTHSYKLQLQVDFLESNPDYTFVCHRFKIFEEKTKRYLKEYAYNYYNENLNLEITLDLFSKTWITQYLTTLARVETLNKITPLFNKYKYNRDVHLYYHLLKEGKGISLNKEMGIYRWQNTGVASNLRGEAKYAIAYKIYKEIYDTDKDKSIKSKYLKNTLQYLRFKKMDKESFTVFFNGLKICDSISNYINMFISFLVPRLIINPISRWIRNKKLKEAYF